MQINDTNPNSSKRQFLQTLPKLGAAGLFATSGVAGAAELPSVGDSSRKLRKIGLEEHFMMPSFLDYLAETRQNIRPELYSKAVPLLSDFGDRRLEIMDRNGVDFVVLSLSGPGVQIEPDTRLANRLARECNDFLARQVQARPKRYAGFAHLALQDPAVAADELERCVKQLGFKGALINGATNGVYLDDRRYDVFWERVQALQVPIYLHPANPVDHPAMYAGHPEMWGPTWSWAAETCSHAMRLIFSGVFDRYPRVKLILGHMGETLPIQVWRLDSRYAVSNQKFKIAKKPSDYVRQNIAITTSGVCDDGALRCSIDALGVENVMFSIDYPFEDTQIATEWIKAARLTDAERQMVAHQNATRLLRL